MRKLAILLLSGFLFVGGVNSSELVISSDSDWSEGTLQNVTLNDSRVQMGLEDPSWSYEENPGIERNVTDIAVNGSHVYLSVQGKNEIVQLDLENGNLQDSEEVRFVGENRLALEKTGPASYSEEIFASSENNVRRFKLQGLNENTSIYPLSKSSQNIGAVEAKGDRIYFYQNNSLQYYWKNGTRDIRDPSSDIDALEAGGSLLYVGAGSQLYTTALDDATTLETFTVQGEVEDIEINEEGGAEYVYVLTAGNTDSDNNLYKLTNSLARIWRSEAPRGSARDLSVKDSRVYTAAGGEDSSIRRHDSSTGNTLLTYNYSEIEDPGVNPTSIHAVDNGVVVGASVDLQGFIIQKISAEYKRNGFYESRDYNTGYKGHFYDYVEFVGDLKGETIELDITTSRNDKSSGSKTFTDTVTIDSPDRYQLEGLKDKYIWFNFTAGRASDSVTPSVDELRFGYFDEPLPRIEVLEPENGVTTENPASIKVNVTDPDGDTLDVNITDESGALLNSTTVTGSENVTAEYPNPDLSSDNEFTVNASKGSIWKTRTFTFDYIIRSDTKNLAAELEMETNYTALIGSQRTTQLVQVFVKNPSRSLDRTYELDLSTESSSIAPVFQSSGSQLMQVDLGPGEREPVLLQVPTTGEDTVNLKVTDTESGISRSISFDVKPVDRSTTEVRSVPGIGVLNVLVLGLAATAYSLLL